MSSIHNFPVILVSAGSKLLANGIISDIIDHEPPDLDKLDKGICCRLWRITNKYYTADVHLHPVTDSDNVGLNLDPVQAHIIYLSEDECVESVAEGRAAAVPTLGVESTRLVLAVCAEPSESLSAWALRQRYELVPLLEDASVIAPAGPFPELCGLARARAALHAQHWHSPISPTCNKDNLSDGDSSDGGQYESGGEESAVERMEEFASLVGVLGDGERGHLASLPRAERLRRAEHLVAAFCRALGQDPDC